jgi:transposase
MTHAEKVTEAQRLRAEGLKLREIGERMGVPLKTAANWLSAPDGSRLRARKESYRGTCVDCGAPTNGSRGRGPNAPKRCVSCEAPRAAQRQRERFASHKALIERLWAQGLKAREIGWIVGWSSPYPAQMIASYRCKGYDLPVRNAGSSAWNKAHPEHLERNKSRARLAA